jgi:hypothetical protein
MSGSPPIATATLQRGEPSKGAINDRSHRGKLAGKPEGFGGSQFDHEVEFGRLLALLDRAINMRRLRQTVFWPQVKPGSELVLSRARIVDRR